MDNTINQSVNVKNIELNVQEDPNNLNNNKNDTTLKVNNEVELNKQLRRGFIRKVYGILSLQLFITFSIACFGLSDSVKAYYNVTPWPFYTAIGLSFLIMIALVCFKSLSKQVPINYTLLFCFTLCESIIISYVFSQVPNWRIIITAGCITVIATVALSLYACFTKTDFTFLGGLLFVGIALLICLGLFTILIGSFLPTLYCILSVLVYSLYLIYDTQLIMGRFGIEYSIDDYIIAALNIYIDIIQLFLSILSLLNRGS